MQTKKIGYWIQDFGNIHERYNQDNGSRRDLIGTASVSFSLHIPQLANLRTTYSQTTALGKE